MRIRLALELPTAALEAVNQHADMDLAISFRVLQDPAYARYYARRPPGRELILDNGLFELGAAAGWEQLGLVAALIRPNYIICPDRLNDGAYNLQQLKDSIKGGLDPERLGVVITGICTERLALVEHALELGVGLLCFPHTEERLAWFAELRTLWPGFGERRLHLLGFQSFEELKLWRQLDLPRLSIDTSKVAKLARLGRLADDGEPLRGLLPAKEVFDLQLSEAELELCKQNVQLFRERCA